MGRRQPRSQHLPGLPIQSTPDDRTGVNIQPDTSTLTDHWGLPRLWLYRQGPSLRGNPRSSVPATAWTSGCPYIDPLRPGTPRPRPWTAARYRPVGYWISPG